MLKWPTATQFLPASCTTSISFFISCFPSTNHQQAGCQLALQSQIDFDIAGRRRTADQHVARGWRLEWIGLIVDSSSDQCALAGMADPGAAGPLHGNVASFREFQQTGKP